MLVSALIAIVLAVVHTPQAASGDDTNVFLDLGSEHCATEIVFAAYGQAGEPEILTTVMPAYVTYSAFRFESAEQAEAALEDSPQLVAETFSGDPDVGEHDEFDRTVTEVQTEEYGDRSSAYVMTLPPESDLLAALTIEMVGIVKGDQLLLILMFSETGISRPGTGLSLEMIPPFGEGIDDAWDGTGDLRDAIPDAEQLPPGWERRDVTIDDPPGC